MRPKLKCFKRRPKLLWSAVDKRSIVLDGEARHVVSASREQRDKAARQSGLPKVSERGSGGADAP